MNTKIEKYINSGILEAYVTGAATADEERLVLQLKQQHPEVRRALYRLETDMELLAQSMAILPPPGSWDKIEAEIDALIAHEKPVPQPFSERQQTYNPPPQDNAPGYIDMESESNHIRVHKAWKWVLAAVFILGKIFLGTAIYFYLENRQAQQQIKDLKTEIKALK
ncbi:MAG: hypothetical protein V4592_23305 [Bacteroidota bacterium]